MGNRSTRIGTSDTVLVSRKNISVREEIIRRKNKTKTGFVLIIAMCCSTVINTIEPEDCESGQNEERSSEPSVPTQTLAPRKPLNSRPRVRSYGYRVTRVAPLILSVDGVEDMAKPREKPGDQAEVPGAVSQELGEPKPELKPSEGEELNCPPVEDKLCLPTITVTRPPEEKVEKASLTWTERLRKETEEKIEKDLERSRARSAMMNTIAHNELQRRKHLQTPSHPVEGRRRQTRKFPALAPITEDKEGEEMEREKFAEFHRSHPTALTPLGSRRSSVAPIVIKNRLQKRLIRKDLYFKAIQELLEIGDAYRVSREVASIISESDDEEDDLYDHSPFPSKFLQRKMSLAGTLEQSAAERAGFAALLAHKLTLLLMEDEIESEASHVLGQERRSQSDSAPPCLAMTNWTGSVDLSSWEDITIINESDCTVNSRGWISQLTTPCATPELSLDSLSPRTLQDWSQASSHDQPLYQSYFWGLDQIGLESSEDLSDDSDSVESDIYQVPDRTRSAPSRRRFDKMSVRSNRPKSCTPLKQ